MIVLLLLVFNWLLLFFVIDLVMQFFWAPTNFHAFICGLLAFLIVVGLAFLFNSSAGQWLLRFISGARQSIAREDDKIKPLIEDVQAGINIHLGLTPLPVHLMIVDDPIPNAFAVGKHTLILSRALYETATDDEICGVLAHEFGHLHNGDSNKLGIALGVSIVSMVIAWVAGLVAMLLQAISQIFGAGKDDVNVFISIFALVFSLVASFFLLFVSGGNFLLKLGMLFVGRKQEHKADEFAVKAGFGAGLLSFLEKLKNMEFGAPKNLFEKLYTTHPATMLRIGEVEKILQE